MAQSFEAEINALAVYGSLAPGETNHWVVSRLAGEWVAGTAQGYQFEVTWGPAEGYQGFVPDRDGPAVPVWVLISEDLAKAWREIDDFEGSGYERRVVSVTLTAPGAPAAVDAYMYVALTEIE